MPLKHRVASGLLLLASFAVPVHAGDSAPKLPAPETVLVNKEKGEIIITGVIQNPRGKPCIDAYGERVQAFVGCARAAGSDAKMAGYFVFLIDVPTEKVYQGLIDLGARPLVHCSIRDGKKRTGLTPKTKPDDYLQGDPVVLSVFWKEKDRWVEYPYEHFVSERVLVEGTPVEKPWTPHFVFHGSGAIHKSGTGCVACPCDCPGGIIADNRYPIYDPKPLVKFHMNRAPRVGSRVYVRIRAVTTRAPNAGNRTNNK